MTVINQDIFNELESVDFIKIIVSNQRNKNGKYRKIEVNLIEDTEKSFYQVSYYTQSQVFHKNILKKEDVLKEVFELFEDFKQLDVFDQNYCTEIKASKKGKFFAHKTKLENAVESQKAHNVQKKYILTPEMKIPALIDLGIITKEGKVISKAQAKFRQINKFLEIIDSEIKDVQKKELKILDFGCGKSYLTFILYYYLTYILGKKVEIIGIDLKKEVVDNCNNIAQKYGYKNLVFEVKDIKDFSSNENFDIMVSLHACDTATDYALYNAIRLGIKFIFSVPCCQHEIFHQLNDTFDFITKYSILKERFSAIFTDAIRGGILESVGYKVKLCEFIDFEGSPKNILIKAVKKDNSKIDYKKLQEINDILTKCSCKQTLFENLKSGELDENKDFWL